METETLNLLNYFIMGNLVFYFMRKGAEALSTSKIFKKYESESELQKILNEESEKLFINPNKIKLSFSGGNSRAGESGNVKFNYECDGKSYNYIPEDLFKVNLNKEGFRKSVIRHELAHIKNGDLNYPQIKKDISNLESNSINSFLTGTKILFRHYYLREPRAAFYGLTGWKVFLKNKD